MTELWADPTSGAYREAVDATTPDGSLRRFVGYYSSTEEIDVDAHDEAQARRILAAASERDYDQGDDGIGRLVAVEEKLGWYL